MHHNQLKLIKYIYTINAMLVPFNERNYAQKGCVYISDYQQQKLTSFVVVILIILILIEVKVVCLYFRLSTA